MAICCSTNSSNTRLASVGILGKERQLGIGKVSWSGILIRYLKEYLFRSKSRLKVF